MTSSRKNPHESLATLIQYVRDHSPFYRELYQDLPVGVATLAHLPVIDQRAFWEANSLDDNRLLTAPMSDGIILKSGGTTGKPKFSVFSRDEWAEFTQTFAEKLAKTNLRNGDRVANLFYVGDLYGSFIFTHKVLEDCPTRVLQLPIGGITPIPSIARTIMEYGATVIAGLPTTLAALLDEIENFPDRYGEKFEVKTILFAGEPLPLSLRVRMIRIFPSAVIQSIGYASNDAGLLGYSDFDCGPNEFRCYDGEAIYEIIDEGTGAVITETAQEGLAVVTGLKRSLMPVIRYPVGDRAQWLDPVGTKDRKFLLLGRSDEAARIASLSLRFEDIHGILRNFSNRLKEFQFQLLVKHEESRDGLTIRIGCQIETSEQTSCEGEIIRAVEEFHPIYRQFVTEGKIHPIRIEWSVPATLEVNARTGKLKRVIDCRSMTTSLAQ